MGCRVKTIIRNTSLAGERWYRCPGGLSPAQAIAEQPAADWDGPVWMSAAIEGSLSCLQESLLHPGPREEEPEWRR
jgi:hypothetical protein